VIASLRACATLSAEADERAVMAAALTRTNNVQAAMNRHPMVLSLAAKCVITASHLKQKYNIEAINT
jgi:hypothetical protein